MIEDILIVYVDNVILIRDNLVENNRLKKTQTIEFGVRDL